MTPKILFENADLLVLNKPAGLVVHEDGKHEEPTVVDWILKKYPEVHHVGEEGSPFERSGIVHRIDRDTSGCLVIVKTQEAFENLKKQFHDHTIKKKYIAVVYGWPKHDRGLIDEPIGRSPANVRAWTTKRGARGTMRPAITRYVVKNRSEHEGEKFSIIELYPQTGRTHQLRVHMGYLGHPLVSDSLYAKGKGTKLPIARTALHAAHITFHLLDGKEITVEAPLPNDLAKIISL